MSIYKEFSKSAILTTKQTKSLVKKLKAKKIKPVNGIYNLSKLGGKYNGFLVVEVPVEDERLWK